MPSVEKKKDPILEILPDEEIDGINIEPKKVSVSSAGPVELGSQFFKSRTFEEGIPKGTTTGVVSPIRGLLEWLTEVGPKTDPMQLSGPMGAGLSLSGYEAPENKADPFKDFKGLLDKIELNNEYTKKYYPQENFTSLLGKFFKSGTVDDLQNFTDFTANQVAQQVPTQVALWASAAAGIPGPLALSVLGASAAGNKYLEDQDLYPDLKENQRIDRANISGVSAGATEGIGYGLSKLALKGKTLIDAIPPNMRPVIGQALGQKMGRVYSDVAKAIGKEPAKRAIFNALSDIGLEGFEETVDVNINMASDESYRLRFYTVKQKLSATIEAFGISAIASGMIGGPMIAASELQNRRQESQMTGNPSSLPTPEELFTASHIIKVYKNGLEGSKNPENQIHVVDGDVIVLEALVADMIKKQEWYDPQPNTIELLGGHLMNEVKRVMSDQKGSANIPLPNIDPETTQGIYQGAINRMQAIEDTVKKAKKLGARILPGEDPGIRARTYLGIEQKVNTMLEEKTFHITPDGEIQISGEGLKPILLSYEKDSPVKDKNKRNQDLKDYLISKRIAEDLQRAKSEFDQDFIASKQQTDAANTKLNTLEKEYGQYYSVLENTANRLYSFQRRILYNLVDSGNMSIDQYNKITALNPHYVSFERVIDENENAGTPITKRRFSGAKSPIKKIQGSELEVHDPIESIIKNTYKIMDIAERNYVARGLANLTDVLPDDISHMDPMMVPVAREDFQVQVDPILKAKLTKVIENLHGKFDQKFNIGGKRLGYYVHPANEIVTKIGSREDVLAHEVGHFLDMVYGLEAELVNNPETNKELRIIADKRYENVPVTEGYKKYVRQGSEKIAALVDAYITKPYLVEQLAPKSGKVLKDLFDKHAELEPLRDARPGLVISTEKFTKTIFRQSPFVPKGNVIEYYDNGNRLFIEVSKNLYQAMTGLNETSIGLFFKMLSVPANLLRKGATLTPEFMLRNPIRDQFTAFLNTNIGFIPFVDPAFALADIIGKKQAYYDWLRSGGAYSGFVELNRKSLKKRLNKIMDDKNMFSKLNIISTAESISQLFEQATRVGIYKAAIRKGLSPLEAGFESREGTTDFARRGSRTKDINASVAFFNAGLQGVDKAFRAAAANPMGLTAKAIATITIPSILLYLLNADDPDYEEIPRWQKNLFWLIKIPGTHTFFRIPKPFMYGQVFGTMPERFLDYLKTNNLEELKSLAKSLYDSISPVSGDPATGLLATAVKPIIENAANWNFFMEKNIVPYWNTNLIPSEQYNKNTTRTAKEIGKLINRSPAKIENLAQGWLGGSGKYALQLGDQILKFSDRISGKGVKPERPIDLSDIPLVKGFVTSPSDQTPQSVQDFYGNFKQIQSSYFTVTKLFKEGRDADAKKLMKERPEGQHYKGFNKASQALSDISKEIDRVSKQEIPDSVKRSEIKKLEDYRLNIAKKMNGLLKTA